MSKRSSHDEYWQNAITNEPKRGDIFYVAIPNSVGHEMRNDRPGVIVSCDALNHNSGQLTVALCSKSNTREMPCHVAIQSATGSTVMCEHITTVDRSRLGRYLGTCTEEEMDQINAAIGNALNLPALTPCKADKQGEKTKGDTEGTKREAGRMAAVMAETEVEVYKSVYENLLDKVLKRAMSVGVRADR